jgi:hypothetical protein
MLKNKPDFEYLELEFEHVNIPNMVYDSSVLCVQARHY